MDADLDTLATALYVRVDDALKDDPALRPWRPKVGIAPKLSDAELVTIAVLQALLGWHCCIRAARRLRSCRGTPDGRFVGRRLTLAGVFCLPEARRVEP